jgi:hypothetical protein
MDFQLKERKKEIGSFENQSLKISFSLKSLSLTFHYALTLLDYFIIKNYKYKCINCKHTLQLPF